MSERTARFDTAMVLAAGLGKRMRPLTASKPKPLVGVAGRPLLDHTLDRLRAAEIRRAVVNVHYLADALVAHLEALKGDLEIIISDEREQLLETGGGIVKALPLIDRDSFYVVNSDVLWIDGPTESFAALAARWDDERMDALLMLVAQARANCHGGRGDFHMDPLGRIRRRGRGKIAPFVYAGVQLLSRRLFDDAPEGPFSTNLLWDRAIEAGRAFGLAHQGLWFDVGTPPAIQQTEAILADA